VDIDEPIFSTIKAVQKREGKALGRVISDLLAVGLAARNPARPSPRTRFHWISKSMGARIDLADREAVYAAMAEGRK
jgi:hypothetical protein